MSVEEISLDGLQYVFTKLQEHPSMFYSTPVIHNLEQQLKEKIPNVSSLSLKLESMQCTGSFKARGVVSQFLALSKEDVESKRTLVTMSAGNYGKAFAYVAKSMNMPAIVCMPDSAPNDRKLLIKSLGARVISCDGTKLIENVAEQVKQHGGLFLHSFDDLTLIQGHASAGLELATQVSEVPDVVLICCGGGGLLSGVATALKLLGWSKTRIYGVEPVKAPTMYDAVKAGFVTDTKVESTIASGLSPPFAGKICLQLIQKHVQDILLVSDKEIQRAMATLFDIGLVAEPSGAAAFAALLSNKVPDVENRSVVAFLTGRNVSANDFFHNVNSAC